MKWLKTFGDMKLELIRESKLYFLPPFRNTLSKLVQLDDTGITKELLELEGGDINPDMTLIGVGDEGDISFVQMGRVVPLFKKNFSMDIENWDEESLKNLNSMINRGDLVYKKKRLIDVVWGAKSIYPDLDIVLGGRSRNSTGIGRFVRRVLVGKSNRDIERFVNLWKSISRGGNFKIVEGKEILDWYSKTGIKGGTLKDSCMNFRGNNHFLDLYVENPDRVRLLVLVNIEGEFIGRALVWKVDHPKFEYLMDRIYYVEDSIIDKFKGFAKEQKWGWKTYQSHSKWSDISYVGGNDVIEITLSGLKIPKKFPYVDTFQFFSSISGEFYNWDNNATDKLDRTDGDSLRIRVFSKREGVYLNARDSVETDEGDWIRFSDAVRTSRGWLHRDDCIELVNGKFGHKEDSIWSNTLGGLIDKGDSNWVKIDSDNFDWLPRNLLDKEYFRINGEYFYKSLCVKCLVSNGHILKERAIKVRYFKIRQKIASSDKWTSDIVMDKWGWDVVNRFWREVNGEDYFREEWNSEYSGHFGYISQGETKIWDKFIKYINPYFWISRLQELGGDDFKELGRIIKERSNNIDTYKWAWENFEGEFPTSGELIPKIESQFREKGYLFLEDFSEIVNKIESLGFEFGTHEFYLLTLVSKFGGLSTLESRKEIQTLFENISDKIGRVSTIDIIMRLKEGILNLITNHPDLSELKKLYNIEKLGIYIYK
jgi:hypothetical protein